MGLNLCLDKGLYFIELNIDSLVAFSLLINDLAAYIKNQNALSACEDVISALHMIKLKICPRELNQVVDSIGIFWIGYGGEGACF